jgi:hypothetical protein
MLPRFMENGSLAGVIKKYGSFSESLTAIYITQVLRGLKVSTEVNRMKTWVQALLCSTYTSKVYCIEISKGQTSLPRRMARSVTITLCESKLKSMCHSRLRVLHACVMFIIGETGRFRCGDEAL